MKLNYGHHKASLTPATGSGRASSSGAGASLPDGGGDGGPVPHLLGPHPGLHPPAGFWPPQLRSIQGESLSMFCGAVGSAVVTKLNTLFRYAETIQNIKVIFDPATLHCQQEVEMGIHNGRKITSGN